MSGNCEHVYVSEPIVTTGCSKFEAVHMPLALELSSKSAETGGVKVTFSVADAFWNVAVIVVIPVRRLEMWVTALPLSPVSTSLGEIVAKVFDSVKTTNACGRGTFSR